MKTKLSFSAPLWRYQGPAAWYFLTVPPKLGASLRAVYPPRRPGFGSVRVLASIGEVRWPTSLFPDSKTGSYLLPVKAAVRKRGGLTEGERVTVTLQLL